MDRERFEELAEKAVAGELPAGFGVQEVAGQLHRLADAIDGDEVDAETSSVVADILVTSAQVLSKAAITAEPDMNMAEASVASIRSMSRDTLERWIRERTGLPDHYAIDEVLVGQEAVDALNEEGAIYELVELADESMVGVTRTVDGELRPFRTIDVATGLNTADMLDDMDGETP